jgi:hypothetical protein
VRDLLAVLGLIAFFALSAGFIGVCARIIGPDPEGVTLSSGPGEEAAGEHAAGEHAAGQEVAA